MFGCLSLGFPWIFSGISKVFVDFVGILKSFVGFFFFWVGSSLVGVFIGFLWVFHCSLSLVLFEFSTFFFAFSLELSLVFPWFRWSFLGFFGFSLVF